MRCPSHISSCRPPPAGRLCVRHLLIVAAAFIGLAPTAAAQVDLSRGTGLSTQPAGWVVTAAAAYHAGPGPSYGSTRLGVAFRQARLRLGARLHLNEQLNFTFAPGDLIIRIDGEPGRLRRGTRLAARPDRYTLGVPADAFVTYRRGQAEVTGLVSLLWQHGQVELPEPQVEDGLYVINWRQAEARQYRLTGGLIAGYHWRGMSLSAGALALPVAHFGDRSVPHAYRPSVHPYLGAAVEIGHASLSASTTTQEMTLTLAQALPHPWRSAATGVRLQYETGLNGHAFHALHAGLEMPLTERVDALVIASQTWASHTNLQPVDFQAWQRTLVPHGGETFHHGLPHSLVRAGLRVRLGSRAAPAIELHDFDLRQDHFYTANRTFYARNPIGTVDLYNASNEAVHARLVVETTDTGGRYQSEPFVLPPRGERRVPLFLYLGETAQASRHEQLIITAELGAHATVLGTASVVTHGPNAWDGDTWSLRYFVAPEDPDVRQRSKQLFLETHDDARTATDGAQRYAHLQAFLAALGQNLAYVEDPTTTRTLDRVQYPVETLREGGGDCEDLTVFLASSLMAVGIDAAVVDVRPVLPAEAAAPTAAPDAIGHVFLLVDTGVEASQMSTLGLNEFQGLTRRSADGRSTIWVPIETAALAEGFEAAFRAGVRQYYDAVFRDDGVATGRVRVYDF